MALIDDRTVVDIVGHLELADDGRNGVVAFLGSTIPRDAVSVIAFAHIGLRARGGEGRGFIVHEAFNGAIGGKRVTVVLSLRTVRSHRECRRRHFDGAGDLLDIELIGHVFALGVFNDQGIGVGNHVVDRDIGSRRARLSLLKRVALGELAHRDSGAMRLAAVGELATRGGDHDFVGVLGNGERAELLAGKRVVLSHLLA